LSLGIGLSLGAPLVGALVLAARASERRPWVGNAALGAAVASALGIALLGAMTGPTGTATLRTGWAPAVGIRFDLRVDGLSLVLLGTVAAVTVLALVYAGEYYARRQGAPASLYAWILLLLAGMVGTGLATDIIQFYVFWELMLVASVALVGFWGESPDRGRVALSYFVYSHVGAVLLLAGLLGLWAVTGSTDLYGLAGRLEHVAPGQLRWLLGLLLAGLAVKLGLFPVHGWLPDTYRTAPLPAVIAMAGAMMGAGIYALVRLVFTAFPATLLLPWAGFLLTWAVVTQLYGALMALVQREVRRLAAYSTMSQMGYVLLGVASVHALGLAGSVMHVVTHGLAKALLFMAVGALLVRAGTEQLGELGGLAARMPLTAAATLVAVLSLAGVPLLAGFHSEWLILAGGFGSGYVILAAAATLGSVLTAAYGLNLVRRAFFGPLPRALAEVNEAPGAIAGTMAVTGLAVLLVGLVPSPIVGLVSRALAVVGIGWPGP